MIRKIAMQIGVPALLAFIACNAYLAMKHLKEVEKISAHTLESSEFQGKLAVVLKDVTDMETGQRGYLLTANPDYLQPYNEANSRIATDFSNLRAVFANRAQSEQSLESHLESLIQSKQAELERAISLRQQGYRKRAFNLVDTNEGKGYMDEIRRITSSLSSAESDNLARSEAGTTAERKRIWSETIMANSGLFVLAAFLFWLIRRHGQLLSKEASQSRTELAAREFQLQKLTSALTGEVRSSIITVNTNSRLLVENFGSFLPRKGHEYAEEMIEAAAQIERVRADLVGSQNSEQAA